MITDGYQLNSEVSQDDTIDLCETQHIPSSYISVSRGTLLILTILLIGIFYVFMQWYTKRVIEDATFVSMQVGATTILVLGMRSIYKFICHGFKFYTFTMPPQDRKEAFKEHNRLCTSVVHSKGMTLSGLGFGTALGIAPVLLSTWNNATLLQWLLSSFLFATGYVSGIGLYFLIAFFIHSVRMGRIAKVGLWQRENPSITFLLAATRRISLLAAGFISICISSILFSKFRLEWPVIAYSAVSASIILSCLVILPFLIVRKLSLYKRRILSKINRQLQEEFHRRFENEKSSKDETNFRRIERLIFLREKVDAEQIWPFKLSMIGTVASVLCLSLIPVLIQFVLQRIAGL